VLYIEAYSLSTVIKPLATIAVGWAAYALIFKSLAWTWPRRPERLEHLIGAMTLILVTLYWAVWI